jgi:hypothetical protein
MRQIISVETVLTSLTHPAPPSDRSGEAAEPTHDSRGNQFEQLLADDRRLGWVDKAGWHIADDLVVPANITPVFLPPYSPEINPIKRL